MEAFVGASGDTSYAVVYEKELGFGTMVLTIKLKNAKELRDGLGLLQISPTMVIIMDQDTLSLYSRTPVAESIFRMHSSFFALYLYEQNSAAVDVSVPFSEFSQVLSSFTDNVSISFTIGTDLLQIKVQGVIHTLEVVQRANLDALDLVHSPPNSVEFSTYSLLSALTGFIPSRDGKYIVLDTKTSAGIVELSSQCKKQNVEIRPGAATINSDCCFWFTLDDAHLFKRCIWALEREYQDVAGFLPNGMSLNYTLNVGDDLSVTQRLSYNVPQASLEIANRIDSGEIEQAYRELQRLNPLLLEHDEALSFAFKKQMLIHLLRTKREKEALTFGQDEFGPWIEAHLRFLGEFEFVSTAFLYQDTGVRYPWDKLFDVLENRKLGVMLRAAAASSNI